MLELTFSGANPGGGGRGGISCFHGNDRASGCPVALQEEFQVLQCIVHIAVAEDEGVGMLEEGEDEGVE